MNGHQQRLERLAGGFKVDSLDDPDMMRTVWDRIVQLDGVAQKVPPPQEGETLREWYARRGCPVSQ
ncbi:MAG: hypothetical protein ACOYXN_13590 [Acidobacteriota bacterium]